MKTVGIKVLKDNLSKYLKMVRGGETILVMDRDKVIAEIRQPALHPRGGTNRLHSFLDEESRRGSVTLATVAIAPPLSKLRDVPRPKVPVDVHALLDQARAD